MIHASFPLPDLDEAAKLAVLRGLDDWRRGYPALIEPFGATGVTKDRGWLALPLDTACTAGKKIWRYHLAGDGFLLRAVSGRIHQGILPADLNASSVLATAPDTGYSPDTDLSDDLAQCLVRAARLSGLLPILAMGRYAEPVPKDLQSIPADALLAHFSRPATLYLAAEARLPIHGDHGAIMTTLAAFRSDDGGPTHLALRFGAPDHEQPVTVRLHSACFTGDLLGSMKCDCGDQLHGAIDILARKGGYLLYLAQEGRGLGLVNKLRAYELQDQGFDTVEANEILGFAADERHFSPAVQMLRHFGVRRVRLLTNNPRKMAALSDAGLDVTERVGIEIGANPHNQRYLTVKAEKLGHWLHRRTNQQQG